MTKSLQAAARALRLRPQSDAGVITGASAAAPARRLARRAGFAKDVLAQGRGPLTRDRVIRLARWAA